MYSVSIYVECVDKARPYHNIKYTILCMETQWRIVSYFFLSSCRSYPTNTYVNRAVVRRATERERKENILVDDNTDIKMKCDK